MRSSYVQFPEFLRVCLVVLKSKSNLLVSYYFAKHICRSYHFIFFIFFFYYQNLLFRCIMIGARLMIIIHERQKLTFSYACNGYFLLSLSFWKLVLFYFVCLHNILWTSNLSKISIMCCYLHRNLWSKANHGKWSLSPYFEKQKMNVFEHEKVFGFWFSFQMYDGHQVLW